ncbi:uncharacterized protein PHACADRAFT_259674 [Phanerochaete carnosa HHB-10118-sp]|uniref:Non-ribosomal peptide synthetase n=1 Tax=Phanerochaete carnosa (strain HHB-10118-sp) TaxID=650164 RepID=K5WSJ6_PHACS|nr:uncharacterized protein PHACADRAFT_259674 [Phanerochaete carnosa HHB-10118-sp]EKM53357.1 hypothetical protein PHACADRAFT_259674 [Phanerochaete carnosa HHB-10118-sp]
MSDPLVSPTGVIFSDFRLPENERREKTEKNEVTTTVNPVDGSGSADGSRAPSLSAAEKGERTLADDDRTLARYLVPTLEKGRKNALLKKPSLWTKFRVWYNPYRIMFSIIFTLNIVAIGISCTRYNFWRYAERNAAALALGNLTAAVACRNEFFLRYAIFWPTVKAFQKWTPLRWRIFLTAFIQHIGGIHSGCAVSAVAWLFFLVIREFQKRYAKHTPSVVLAWGIITLVFVNVTMWAAMPWIRAHHHNFFEQHHRFAGWISTVVVWIYVCVDDSYNQHTGKFHSSGSHLAMRQEFWYAMFITILIGIPWMTVRKVPVEITTPSPRVAIIKFNKGVQQGLLGRISRSSVMEYHGFGIISEGVESRAHYIIAGVQGDWTRGLVADPPGRLWTREMKFAGLPYLCHLYRRGIAICTGSGIGAVLSTCVQLDNWFLIWIGSDMEKTFGPVLFDMIHRRIPKERYILFDTKIAGRRPDTMKMLKDIYVAFKAEVVIITSNPQGNAELMQGCKENGMHSFGPLWDS